MTKTFEHINYHTMKTLYDKCEKIVNDIESSIPEDTTVEDYVTVKYNTPSYYYEDSTYIYLGKRNTWFFCEDTVSVPRLKVLKEFKYLGDEVIVDRIIFNSTMDIRESLYDRDKLPKDLTFSLEDFIKESTKNVTYEPTAIFTHNSWLEEGSYTFHKTCYNSAKSLIETLSKDSDVNVLNMTLAATITFLEELEEDAWLEGLKSFDKDEVQELLKFKVEAKKKEVLERATKNYEEAVEAYKKEILSRTVVRKPSPEYTYKDEPVNGFWTRLKNVFKGE